MSALTTRIVLPYPTPLSYQEDSHQFAALSLNPEELRVHAKKFFNVDWAPDAAGEALARQVLFVGIYDG